MPSEPTAAACEASGPGVVSLPLRAEDSPSVPSRPSDQALEESLRDVADRSTRWIQAPQLVVLQSVMAYRSGTPTEYEATSDHLTNAEVDGLIADLTHALAVLTGNTFTQFADVRVESPPAGAMLGVMRPGQIVVGRYRGVRDRLKTIGVGGRIRSAGAIKGGTIFLDDDYDRTSTKRALLRTHELGHALGYDHVDSQPSIMNSRIGAAVTEFDRRAALVAFRHAQTPRGCPLL